MGRLSYKSGCLFDPALDDAGLSFFQMRAISSSCFRDGVHRSSLLLFDVLFALRRRHMGSSQSFAFRLGVHRSEVDCLFLRRGIVACAIHTLSWLKDGRKNSPDATQWFSLVFDIKMT
jgi:hypothetical protein